MAQYVATAIVVVVLVVVLILAVLRKRSRSSGQNAPRSGQSGSSENCQLYIGNVSYRLSEGGLRSFFEKFGEIESVRVIKDRRTGRSKGFAFITFASAADAKQALSAHEEELNGRALIVRHAKPSP